MVTNTVVETASATSDLAFSSSGGGWGASNYNAAGGAAVSNDAPGANSLSDLTAAQIAFVDKANGDLHITRATSSLVEVGTDLSATFTDDIDGETRVAPWDIGADETFPVAAGHPAIRRLGGVQFARPVAIGAEGIGVY